jgi:hypothetical protein
MLPRGQLSQFAVQTRAQSLKHRGLKINAALADRRYNLLAALVARFAFAVVLFQHGKQ